MSDAAGTFPATPTVIGTLSSTDNFGTISAKIPHSTPTGSQYRIRVVSNNPVVTGSDNGTNLRINFPSINVTPNGIQNIDAGDNGATLTVTESPAAISREWFYGTSLLGPYDQNTGVSIASYTPNFTEQGIYYIVCVLEFSCETLTSNVVQINVSPQITTGTISGSPFCAGALVSVPFTSLGRFSPGNIYTAQLSTAAGTFPATPTVIGSLSSTDNSGSISATIPELH